jgi:putative endonuclease
MFNTYFCYIVTNQNHTVLYTEVTNDLTGRTYEHKEKIYKNSFTSRYNIDKLVYFEEFNDIALAIEREKQIKAGSRQKKLKLINSFNPEWKDLYKDVL